MDILALWHGLIWPMLRLLCGLALGLLTANMLESLHWTRNLARLSLPLARAAHLGEMAAASFPLSFISAASANALLGEHFVAGRIRQQELILANLLNALPAYLLHTPTIFLLTWPVLGLPALTYVWLTLIAAALRTGCTLVIAHYMLPLKGGNLPIEKECTAEVQDFINAQECTRDKATSSSYKNRFITAFNKAWSRFLRRLPKLIYITVPVYILMYYLHSWGFFIAAQHWLVAHAHWLSFIKPEAMGIIVLHLAAELGAALGAAGGILHSGSLTAPDIVLALLVGNILSTPMRALRHQLTAYVAYYPPKTALLLIVINQSFRAISLALIGFGYWYFCC